MIRTLAAFVALPALLLGCQPTLLDGGWEGQAVCDDDTVITTEAIFDEITEDDEITGVFVLDLVIDFGLLGIFNTVQRAEIEDGEVDRQDMVFSGKLVPEPGISGGNAHTYTFDVEYSNDDYTELSGDLDRVNGNGESILRCELELDRASDPQN